MTLNSVPFFDTIDKTVLMINALSYPRDWVPSLMQLLRMENAALGPSYRRDVRVWEYAELTPEDCRNRIPSEEHLQALLDISFFSSIQPEEGRSVSLRLAYFSRERADRIAHDRFVFDTPLAFQPQQLTKLSPAFDPRTSYIAVEPAKDGSLQIWGVIHFGRQPPPDAIGHGMPTCLNIVVWRPGVMTLRFANMAFSFRYATGQGMLPTIASTPRDIDRLTSSLLDFPTIQGIGVAMLEKGHGGAIFAVPANAVTPDTISFPKYKAAMPCTILKTRMDAAKCTSEPWAKAELQWAYEFIGSLTAVDGAVVLDSGLTVRGFGAFVKRTDHESILIDLQGKVHDVKQKGTRHASAVSFCESCKSALALVVSQDGGTCLFVKQNEGEIIVVPNIHAYWHPF